MENLVKVTIDGTVVEVPSTYTVLKAAERAGIYIPRLCFLEGIHEESSCRVCVVEIEGQRTLKNSCAMPVADGMIVRTNTPRVIKSVEENLKLVAANHVFECWRCPREHNCELLDLMRHYDVENEIGEDSRYEKKERIIVGDNPAMVLDSGKCVLCGRCVSACKKQSGLSILSFNKRGSHTVIGAAGLNDLEDSGCIYCGKCIQACPTGAIAEKSEIANVQKVLRDPEKFVVVQAAPSVRVALGEEFGMPIGTNVEGKMYAAFEKLGFDQIADVNWGADLTIIEEGNEFIHRLTNHGVLPMFTSCSPGWVRLLETYEPELIGNLSTCKSPHQMSGAMVKHYWAEKLGVDPKKVVVVSIMPCVAKKYESGRPELQVDGMKDVDYVLTTRELARFIKSKGIDFVNLPDVAPKGDLAQFTGAGAIFGVTGGVMEAALRTVVERLEGKELQRIDFHAVRGLKGIKEASLEVAGQTVNVAVVHGGANILEFIKMVKEGNNKYHFVEFMGCVGGCINGGGQPIVTADILEKLNVMELRSSAIYTQDESLKFRQSHKNPAIIKVYDEFLGEPGGHEAHRLLHTHFSAKEMYTKFNQ